MKRRYEAPTMDVKEFAQFENVYTWCTKGNPGQGCVDVDGSGNAATRPAHIPPSEAAAFAGGGEPNGCSASDF